MVQVGGGAVRAGVRCGACEDAKSPPHVGLFRCATRILGGFPSPLRSCPADKLGGHLGSGRAANNSNSSQPARASAA